MQPKRTNGAEPSSTSAKSLPAKSPPATSTPELTDRFFEAILASNPFDRNRVSDPSHLECDVPTIHAKPFNEICRRAESRLRTGGGEGLLLLGNAGVGKSHLIGRLSRWAKSKQICLVALHNIQVSRDSIARYLVKCCISSLAEDREDRLHETRLFRMVEKAIKHAAHDVGQAAVNEENRNEVFHRLADRLGGDRQIFDVLFKFFYYAAKFRNATDAEKRQNYAELSTLALRWLKGDLLDADDARRLELIFAAGQENVGLKDEQVLPVLLALAQVARHDHVPFVLCIDQVENMEPEQLGGLCLKLQMVIDGVSQLAERMPPEYRPALLVIVAGVEQDILRRIDDGTICAAAADRLHQEDVVSLSRIKRDEARELLHARLEKFMEELQPPEPCKPYFVNDTLFPLGETWFQNLQPGELEFRPRDVMSWGRIRWRQIQDNITGRGGPQWLKEWPATTTISPSIVPNEAQIQTAIDYLVADKLIESVNQRQLLPGELPADAKNFCGLTVQLLNDCLDARHGYTLTKVEPRGKQDVDLLIHERLGQSPVLNRVQFVVTASKTSAASRLRQLLNSAADHRILVTESRAPLSLGPAGENYLHQLKLLGPAVFQHIDLTFPEYAQLDAMTTVIGLARSHDLEISSAPGLARAVSPAEVIDSFHRQDRYRQHKLLQAFLTEPPTETATVAELPRVGLLHPVEPFVQYVRSKLSLLPAAYLRELLKGFVAQEKLQDSADDYYEAAKEIVMQMHKDEVVCAKPWEGDLHLIMGTKL